MHILILLMIAAIVLPNGFGMPQQTPDSLASVCRDAVEGMRSLTKNLEFPWYLLDEEPVKTGDELDVNDYFTVLDHLALEEGYVLDYIYAHEFMDGWPFIYIRQADEAPYRTFEDYIRDRGEDSPSYLENIVLDGTSASYIQFVVLAIMANQFYLFQHSNYDDFLVVCENDMLESTYLVVKESVVFMGNDLIPQEVKDRAEMLNFEPVIIQNADRVQIQIIGFTKWGGFKQITFTVGRDFPHRVEREETVLLPYNCGIVF